MSFAYSPYNFSSVSQKCRVLHRQDDAFIILNLQLKGRGPNTDKEDSFYMPRNVY